MAVYMYYVYIWRYINKIHIYVENRREKISSHMGGKYWHNISNDMLINKYINNNKA